MRWLTYKNVFILGLLLVTGWVSFTYRIRNYQQVPFVHNSWDEQEHLWLGKSLLSSGVPASWSTLPIYFSNKVNTIKQSQSAKISGFNIQVGNQQTSLANWSADDKLAVMDIQSTVDNSTSQFRLVQPQLDNPPLAGIIFAIFDPSTSMFHSSIISIRLIAIGFAVLTTIGLFLLAWKLFNLPIALISSLIYAIGPGFVVASRFALPENLLASVYIYSLLLFVLYQQKNSLSKLFIILVLCFLSPLMKMVGLIVPLGMSLIYFLHHQAKQAWLVLVAGCLGVVVYLVYGFFYNANLFIQVLQNQSARDFLGPISVLFKFVAPNFTVPMYDGWLIFAFISLLLFGRVFTQEKVNIVLIAIASHLIFFSLFGGNNYPWYLFMIFPLLSLVVAAVCWQYLKAPQLLFNLLFFVVVFSSLLYYWQLGTIWASFLSVYRLLVAFFVLLPLLPLLWKGSIKYSLQLSLILMLMCSFYMSTRIINNLQYLWPLLSQTQISLPQ
ncbi:glycosyltransferase family 39 protein [Patescibacteria group bacterium]|nr:glycosyltransferase family 39 protein [Patescibacteria group bacterium]